LTSSEIKKLHHPQNGSDSKSIQRTQHYFDDDEKDVELHFKKIKNCIKKNQRCKKPTIVGRKKSIDEIATIRVLTKQTIYSHFVKLIQTKAVAISSFTSR
jgi:hypothetical protein